MWVFAHALFFKIPFTGAKALLNDNTGSTRKPRAGSNPSIASKNRIQYLTHSSLLQALDGQGVSTFTQHVLHGFNLRMDEAALSDDWTRFEDLELFMQTMASETIVETLVGPDFLRSNPSFNEELWSFDRDIPLFARGLPSFITPRARRRVNRLKDEIKAWYTKAASSTDQHCPDGDMWEDPAWGSKLMRDRQTLLRNVDGYDNDCVAATDLGLLWGAVANTLPTIVWSIIHIFEDPSVLDRVRQDVLNMTSIEDAALPESSPLMNSIFAECLRLHGTMYSLISTADSDAQLGKWILPRGKLALINSGLCHMDETIWNTRCGENPITRFWADRFMIYPNDPDSGPLNAGVRSWRKLHAKNSQEEQGTSACTKPRFSIEGLEGSWLPFGGKISLELIILYTCPGRHLARNLVLTICSAIVRDFDLELDNGSTPIVQEERGFGLSMFKPQRKVAFRIKKRREVKNN
ncbi:Pfs, NACHT and ankyrin domain protein [Coniella lustricola]|uniref:Pfs, NACHT and ankyrin domain protein n=1 Tax=Coniella lustricola TaxID=2025994 RepID=A0A2T2ZUP0_9PEZI|nr:Pfs, NACHT and ankyrin domain protein [Coniella lustricola]